MATLPAAAPVPCVFVALRGSVAYVHAHPRVLTFLDDLGRVEPPTVELNQTEAKPAQVQETREGGHERLPLRPSAALVELQDGGL